MKTDAQSSQQYSTACFKCRKEGHQTAECRSIQSPRRPLWGPPKSLPSHRCEPMRPPGKTGGRRVHPLPKDGERTLTTLARSPGENDTDSNDDPLVSGPINPVTVPIELIAQSSGHKGNLMAFLNSGCSRCLVNPALMEKLGVRLRSVNLPVAFCQLDGSVAGGIPVTFVTEPIELGVHMETLNFIMALGIWCWD